MMCSIKVPKNPPAIDRMSGEWSMRKIGLVAILMGLCGFAINLFPLTFIIAPHTVSFLLGSILPMMAAMAWGWRAGLISSLLGFGGLAGFVVYFNNGYGILATIGCQVLWFPWHGWWAGKRRQSDRWLYSAYVVELPFIALYILVIETLFRWAFTFNPPPWAPHAPNSISTAVTHAIAFKSLLNHFFVLAVADVLLGLRKVRQWMGLSGHTAEHYYAVPVTIAFLGGMLAWVIDALFQKYVFHDTGSSLLDYLLRVDADVFLLRMLLMVLAILSGVFIASHFRRRLQTETALRNAQSFTSNLIDTANTMIISLNGEGRVTIFNKAAEQTTGYKVDEVLGKSWFDLMVPIDRFPHVWLEFQRVFQGGVPKRFENSILTKSGEERDILWQNNEIREGSLVTGVISFGLDITEIKRHALEINRLNAELEKRVQVRTAALESANRDLASANKELESFAYSVSHDLRAPLRGIDGWSQALLEDYGDSLDATAQQYLQTVRQETQRMGQLIDAMLNISRVTRGVVRHERVDLSQIATNEINELHRHNPGRKVKVLIDSELTVMGDSLLLRVVLRNLLGNAWKFTERKDSPEIAFGVCGPEGKRAFFVRDNGAGFSMAHATNLFQPFQRLHHVSEFPGHGVGLATVQRIIARHGGTVWAESKEGEGAAFYFSLPEGDAVVTAGD